MTEAEKPGTWAWYKAREMGGTEQRMGPRRKVGRVPLTAAHCTFCFLLLASATRKSLWVNLRALFYTSNNPPANLQFMGLDFFR